MQPVKDYETLQAEYLSSGLTQPLLHMLQRFCSTSEWQLQPRALREVMLRLHLNELELALTYFYYDKTHTRVRVYNREQLLLLCAYHAKHYLNHKFRLYEQAIEHAFPGFCLVYREFANQHCKQDAVDPMSLNSCFLHLRRAPIDPSHMVFDLNHQADLLITEEDLTDSPYKVLREWKDALPGVASQAGLPGIESLAALPVAASQMSMPQQELPTVMEEPAVESDALEEAPPLSLTHAGSFFSSLQLVRSSSLFSQLPQDSSRPS